jgi:hypothetical protein
MVALTFCQMREAAMAGRRLFPRHSTQEHLA